MGIIFKLFLKYKLITFPLNKESGGKKEEKRIWGKERGKKNLGERKRKK